MAKKAPAKRKPNAIELAAPQLAALGKRMDAARKSAKRKPRAKKPVVPAVEPLSEDAKAKLLEALWNKTRAKHAVPVVDATDYGTPIEFPAWLVTGLKALSLLVLVR